MSIKKTTISQRIVKAMCLFGGVQVLTILCSLVRTKLIALWIGPVGVGLFGLFNSAIDMVYTATSFSMRNSSVRDIASASGDTNRSIIIKVVRRWSWLLGMFGAVVMIVLSPWLSIWTFGNDDYTWGFIILSLVILLNSYSSGENSVLQGTGKLSYLARGTLVGTICGTLISIPLFYFWREESIIPTLIVFSTAVALGMWWYGRKVATVKIKPISFRSTLNLGKGFIKLGFFMMLSSVISYLFDYLFLIYLNHFASTSEVGLYQSGFTLVDKYAGLLFSAMAMEYYPRLASAEHSNKRIFVFVTKQINITLLILTPVVVCFMLFRELIVQLLYSSQFMAIIPFIALAVVGTIFRAVSWAIAFVILAKGSGKIFIITESISAITTFSLNIWFYHLMGITGIGIAYTLSYLIYAIVVALFYCRYYKFSIHQSNIFILIFSCAVSLAELFFVMCNFMIFAVIWGVFAISISIFSLFKMLKK